jgi:hypothetical protein
VITTFWQWLISGSENSPAGIFNILNRYLSVHILVAILALLLIRVDAFTFAKSALFPASSILIGISMAWSTRAAVVFQDNEMRERLFDSTRPPEDYVYSFQLAVFVIVFMVCYTAIMAAGGLKVTTGNYKIEQIGSSFFLYFLMSLSVRECWGVVNFTNMLMLLNFRR